MTKNPNESDVAFIEALAELSEQKRFGRTEREARLR